MRGKEDLYYLIQAMSKSEKRYFTLDAQKSGKKGSKYLDLFQAINSMEDYDETKLKKKFPKNLPHDKAYLYEAILRSMRDYRSSKSPAAQIKERLLDAKYLYERGLYDQTNERLKEAKQAAEQLNDRLTLLEINREELKLAWDTKKGNYADLIDQLIGEKESNIVAITQELKYLDLSYQLSIEANKQFEIEDESEKLALKTRFPEALFHVENLPKTPLAQKRFYQSSAIYYQLLGNFDLVFKNYSNVVEWWDNNPKYKEEEFYKYIVDVSNLLHACYYKRQYEYIPELLDKLEREGAESLNLNDQRVVFQKVSLYKLVYHINLGIEDGAEQLVAKIEKGLVDYKINPISQLVISFNAAVLMFILEKYEQCRVWAEKILKKQKVVARQNIFKGTYLLNLAASFELEYLEETEAAIRSTYRYLNSKNQNGKADFYYSTLNFIKKLNASPLDERRSIWKDFKSYLFSLKNNPDEIVPLGLDELFTWWTDSKISNKKLVQIVKAEHV